MPADPETLWGVTALFVLLGGFTLWALVSGRVWRGLFPRPIFDRRDAPIVYWIVMLFRFVLLAAVGLALFRIATGSAD